MQRVIQAANIMRRHELAVGVIKDVCCRGAASLCMHLKLLRILNLSRIVYVL
jgi:hypothetical protein